MEQNNLDRVHTPLHRRITEVMLQERIWNHVTEQNGDQKLLSWVNEAVKDIRSWDITELNSELRKNENVERK